MTQKKQYILTDSSNYMIEEVFGINDHILMLSSQISAMKALMNLPSEDESMQDGFQTCKNVKEEPDGGSSATASQS